MTRRTRKALMLVLGAAFLAALPVVGTLYVTYHQTIEQSHRRLGDLATAVAQQTKDVLMVVEAAIADVTFDARLGCTEALIREFRAKAITVAAIRTMGYLTADGLLRCTSVGMMEPPLWVERDGLVTPPGALLAFAAPGEHAYSGEGTVGAFHRLADGNLLVVEVAPEELTDVAGGGMLLGGVRLEIRVHTLTVAEVGALAAAAAGSAATGVTETAPYLQTSRDVGVYDARVIAGASRDWAVARWHENALVTGGIGALAGLVLAAGAAHLGRKRLSLKAELREGLENKEFEIRYQPVIDLQRRRCAGAEALIRWRHPERDMVPPDLFIALAEESGAIIPMTRWLLRQVGQDMAELLKSDPSLHIGINLAPSHVSDLSIVEDAKAVAAEFGIHPRQIMFELTERGLIDHPACKEVIAALSELGSGVAIDDFGTGYSSLAYIEKFELDYLKVDKVFVSAIGLDSPASRLTEVIIDMARSLRLKTIAEGVETEGQARFLTAKGVDLAQGFYFSRPLTAAAFCDYMAEERRTARMAGAGNGDPQPTGEQAQV